MTSSFFKPQESASIPKLLVCKTKAIRECNGCIPTVAYRKRNRKVDNSPNKASNRQLARERVVIEHINRSLKIFRILAERYRNRRKRFGLRCNLIAALYNHEHSQHQELG
jgi:hypothetical protein